MFDQLIFLLYRMAALGDNFEKLKIEMAKKVDARNNNNCKVFLDTDIEWCGLKLYRWNIIPLFNICL